MRQNTVVSRYAYPLSGTRGTRARAAPAAARGGASRAAREAGRRDGRRGLSPVRRSVSQRCSSIEYALEKRVRAAQRKLELISENFISQQR